MTNFHYGCAYLESLILSTSNLFLVRVSISLILSENAGRALKFVLSKQVADLCKIPNDC